MLAALASPASSIRLASDNAKVMEERGIVLLALFVWIDAAARGARCLELFGLASGSDGMTRARVPPGDRFAILDHIPLELDAGGTRPTAGLRPAASVIEDPGVQASRITL
jgi:hypothetical protein